MKSLKRMILKLNNTVSTFLLLDLSKYLVAFYSSKHIYKVNNIYTGSKYFNSNLNGFRVHVRTNKK
jgi:hypothetical protein